MLPRLSSRGWMQIIGGIFMTTFLAPGEAFVFVYFALNPTKAVLLRREI